MSGTIWKPLLIGLIAIPILSACGDDPLAPDPTPTVASVAGSYDARANLGAVKLTTTTEGVATDWLALGGTVEMTFLVDGTTTGEIFLPGADEDGGDFREDLSGTWTIEDNKVRFQQEADTFIRDMEFEVVGDALVGSRSFGDTLVEMTLLKT